MLLRAPANVDFSRPVLQRARLGHCVQLVTALVMIASVFVLPVSWASGLEQVAILGVTVAPMVLIALLVRRWMIRTNGEPDWLPALRVTPLVGRDVSWSIDTFALFVDVGYSRRRIAPDRLPPNWDQNVDWARAAQQWVEAAHNGGWVMPVPRLLFGMRLRGWMLVSQEPLHTTINIPAQEEHNPLLRAAHGPIASPGGTVTRRTGTRLRFSHVA